MSDAEFFFDPICPWAWITSRWVEEVASQRSLDVDWRFIALRFVNEERYEKGEMTPQYAAVHDLGLHGLRIAAAAKKNGGSEAAFAVYSALGRAIHVDHRRDELTAPDGFRDVLVGAGIDAALVAEAGNDAWDATIREDTEAALARTGKDVGTPIITFGPPDGPSFFGPVISRIPRGAEAVELWDATERIARFPGFAELKRAIRERPVTS